MPRTQRKVRVSLARCWGNPRKGAPCSSRQGWSLRRFKESKMFDAGFWGGREVLRVSDGFIGVFDSGAGGISVLKNLVSELPQEQFLFFGDSANAPYGDKDPTSILLLSRRIVDTLLGKGAKAIVIACNTATSAAAATLRDEYPDVPIVGVEPALKPAVLAFPRGRILVMATAATLTLEKFHRLEEQWARQAEVIPVACVGLVELIERGDLSSPEIHDLLEELVGCYRDKVDAVVLGCTHYPFVRDAIRDVVGDVPFFDGGAGTARQLRTVLGARGLLAGPDATGFVRFASSKDTDEELALYQRFFEFDL